MKKRFIAVDFALKQFGFSDDESVILYKHLVSILFLGNVEFEDTDDHDGCCLTASAEKTLNNAAQLLEIDPCSLVEVLIRRRMKLNCAGEVSEIVFVLNMISIEEHGIYFNALFQDSIESAKFFNR